MKSSKLFGKCAHCKILECKKWRKGVNFLTAWSQNVAHPVIVTFPQIPTVVNNLSIESGTSNAGLTGETSLHVVDSRETARFVVVEWPKNKGSEDWGLLLTQCTVSAESTVQLSDWRLSGANAGWDGNGALRLSNFGWGVTVLKFTWAECLKLYSVTFSSISGLLQPVLKHGAVLRVRPWVQGVQAPQAPHIGCVGITAQS